MPSAPREKSLRDRFPAGSEDLCISEDAGGYVCERCYWEVLGASAVRGVPGVFLHVPPITALSLDGQLGPVRGFLAELVRQAGGAPSS